MHFSSLENKWNSEEILAGIIKSFTTPTYYMFKIKKKKKFFAFLHAEGHDGIANISSSPRQEKMAHKIR